MRELSARHRPQRGALPDSTKIITRRRACWAFRRKAKSPTRRNWNSTSARCVPSVAGPKRPQDRIELPKLKSEFHQRVQQAGHGKRLWQDGGRLAARVHVSAGGESSGRRQPGTVSRSVASEPRDGDEHPTPDPVHAGAGVWTAIRNGSVLIAAITSCTNTSAIPA